MAVSVSYQSMNLDMMALRKGLDLVKFERTKQPDHHIIDVSFMFVHVTDFHYHSKLYIYVKIEICRKRFIR